MDSLRGTIRLVLPVLYGTREVIPRLSKFLHRHPQLQVELTVSDERQDLVAEGADVAIRLGRLDDSVFGARRLATLECYLVASPSYLKARGTPKTPADLATHDCIFGPGGFGRERWTFMRGRVATSADVRGRIRTSSGPGVLASALAGLGIAMASSVMCAQEVKRGGLVVLLPDYWLQPVEVHAIYPGGPHPSAKVRAFVDFLAGELSKSAILKARR